MTTPGADGFAFRRAAIATTIVCAVILVAPAVMAERTGIVSLLRQGPGVSNHPVRVVPSSAVRIPVDWPLENGAITCLTCHEHLPAAGDVRLRDFDQRGTDTIDFCAKCHAQGEGRSAAGAHWMAVGRAHVDDTASSARSLGSLDAESRRCMSCHDGVSAGEFSNSTPHNRGGGAIGDHRRNHPVGVFYPHDAKGSLRHASQLPKQIRLPEGKISCVSCHDLYAQEKDLLTVPIQESALCMACHAMD